MLKVRSGHGAMMRFKLAKVDNNEVQGRQLPGGWSMRVKHRSLFQPYSGSHPYRICLKHPFCSRLPLTLPTRREAEAEQIDECIRCTFSRESFYILKNRRGTPQGLEAIIAYPRRSPARCRKV